MSSDSVLVSQNDCEPSGSVLVWLSGLGEEEHMWM